MTVAPHCGRSPILTRLCACAPYARARHPLARFSRSRLTVGIGDQQPAAYSDARLHALNLQAARMIVPYDAATSEPAKVDAWLAAVRAANLARTSPSST